ncbi:trypsin-like peptidase domain-containing protein [Roseobacter weihaiensis]|uniref:trypsin-like peptidase domain-containing protein n=1 Tax=Roseobacter weihaiensis TaxID=2763262 RepID=UPI001D0B1EC2|nr:trypsin-like peptidase domain-containing protein [Roseobacter sp. H9]
MAEHFLTKSRIDLGRCIVVAGAPALERYEDFFAQVSAKAGPDVAKLFAEPLVSKGNDQAASTVSWYSDRVGQGVPITKLDAAGQQEVGAILTARLQALEGLISDPDVGPQIAAALHIGSAADIWSVEGQPVLVNWGLMPQDGTDAATRAAHYAKTLGAYLPMAAAPPLTEAEQDQKRADLAAASAAAATVPPAAATAAASATEAAAIAPRSGGVDQGQEAATGGAEDVSAPPPSDPPPRGRVPLLAWVPLVVLLLLFGGALAWLLVPGNRIFADDGSQPVIADEETLRAAREINRALEARLNDLTLALDGAVCRADGTLLMPDGLTIEGLLPPELNQGRAQGGQVLKADSTPVLPPAPERVVVPGEAGQVTDTASLLRHIDDRTAMVIVGIEQGMGVGTGFFIAPDLMVTNYHVIEGATSDNIFVTNKSMGGLKRVEILKSFGPMREVGADFALLRVEGVDQPFYSIWQSDASMRLQSVIAAGFPGDVLNTDSEFKALQDGNVAAVPALTVTDGTVNTEQSLSATSSAIVHSAPISTGNSGGPLIDMCGRVVGVNTFVVQGPLRNMNFALATDDLLRFLADTPAQPVISGDVCEPLVARPTPLPVASSQ